MTTATAQSSIEPYTLLRTSLNLFKKPPAQLSPEEIRQVGSQARNEFEIENRVLRSDEAIGVIVPEQELARAFNEIRGRFDSEETFLAALETNGLDESRLRAALARQCKVDAVMERVAARSPKVNEVEIGIYYHLHPEKFRKPEQRAARHILISINADYPENTRENALARISELFLQLQKKPHKFTDLALRHSECPSALNGGSLGTVSAGTLYPELDQALFALKENEISKVVETEIGFHLIQCLKISRAETISLKKATPKIKQLIQDRYRRTCQRTWLASLPAVKP